MVELRCAVTTACEAETGTCRAGAGDREVTLAPTGTSDSASYWDVTIDGRTFPAMTSTALGPWQWEESAQDSAWLFPSGPSSMMLVRQRIAGDELSTTTEYLSCEEG
ncbi:hypothetical protein [Wenxinia saemankumensis]|uniref:Uncharacterized protein n=1 Tax=Wenxinia saemankumensis TaxID=1447782 RepID=A0A1M6A5S9_9RHOB|nr:hypothetical protein [Wenxinia saemankumensis]SHI31826.1 hypothetical protein SAMN05444417_0245 [Wenxinia saemankumensis]